MVNDYDKYAKERQERLLEGSSKPHRFVEKPMMFNMLPDLTNKKILLLGCGTGEETKMLENFGATNMIGIDLSKESIKIAKETYPNHEFLVGDINKLPFRNESFDFVYSSLAIDYAREPKIVYDEAYRVLKKDGQFLFSVLHPVRWSSEKIEIDGNSSKIVGYDYYGGSGKIYGNYMSYILKKHTFPNSNDIESWSGPPSMHFKLLRNSGFSVEDFTESQCIKECEDYDKNYYRIFSEIPQFVAFLARK